MKNSSITVSGIVVGLAVVYLGYCMFSPAFPRNAFNLRDFAGLPIADNGRVKPMDTLARTSMMVISGGRQSWYDEKERNQPAARWLLDVMASALGKLPDDRDPFQHKVFRIENDQVRSLLNLPARQGFRYSIDEIQPRLKEFYQQAHRAQGVESGQRDLYDNKLIELGQHLELFLVLTQRPDVDPHRQAQSPPHMIPPLNKGEEWRAFWEVKDSGQGGDKANSVYLTYLHLLAAYAKDQPEEFNKILKDYRAELEKKLPEEMAAARVEVFFNHFQPFLHCSYLYGIVFVLSCLGWLLWRDLHWAAFWLAVLTCLVQTWALIARMYLSGRPPVTNLYSSAVFIGWTAIIVCLIIEWIFRLGVGNVVGGLIGVLTLIIAHYLSLDGDTMKVLMAVLDTNFWLASHVLVIAMGYTAMFVAGFISAIYVLLGPVTLLLNWQRNPVNLLSPKVSQAVYRMIYGVACFAILTSFVGTVLGGIWADQSWGRFWGWDPKENGALLIVIWCALMLHARWGGLVKARGFALLAILGNIVTAWSWFGTNQLEFGLHSYGRMGGAMTWLLIFAFSQLVLAIVGMIPDRVWLQLAPAAKATPIVPKESPRQATPGKMATAIRG